jgi:FtsZ-interacting cell division protein YlmF
MDDRYPNEEEYSFPEVPKDEREQPETDYGAKGRGFFGKFVGTIKDLFDVSAVQIQSDQSEEEEEAYPEGETETELDQPPAQMPLKPAIDVWSDSNADSSFHKTIETRGITDMPNINSANSLYGKPIFAQRTLKDDTPDELIWEIVEKMRENVVVLLNLEACSGENADKILTFLSGAVCFQQGSVHTSGLRNYVLTPPNANIDSDQEPPHDNFLP